MGLLAARTIHNHAGGGARLSAALAGSALPHLGSQAAEEDGRDGQECGEDFHTAVTDLVPAKLAGSRLVRLTYRSL